MKKEGWGGGINKVGGLRSLLRAIVVCCHQGPGQGHQHEQPTPPKFLHFRFLQLACFMVMIAIAKKIVKFKGLHVTSEPGRVDWIEFNAPVAAEQTRLAPGF